jgi:hypothetical protein
MIMRHMSTNHSPMLDCECCRALTRHEFGECREGARPPISEDHEWMFKADKRKWLRGLFEIFKCRICGKERIWGFVSRTAAASLQTEEPDASGQTDFPTGEAA